MITSCTILLSSSFSSRLDLDLLDSTQISNPPPGFAVRFVRAGFRFVQFLGRFERRRPDVVLLFVAVGASIVEKGAMAWYARLRACPSSCFRAGDRSSMTAAARVHRAWVRCCFAGARKIVCQSEAWQRFAVDMLGFSPGNVVVIRNWTATRELLDIGAMRAHRADPCVRLIYLGWLDREKGVFDLIDACTNLEGMRFNLDFAGEGNASAEARALVESRGLNGAVRFRGWLRGEDLRQALRESDVLVLPSWAEGLPNAMVEGMAARLAVVVTGVGAIPEVITDRVSGMVVESRNSIRSRAPSGK